MNTVWSFLSQYWLSIILIIGILLASWSVYKHRDKLFYSEKEEDEQPQELKK
ncbi:hypothetical protein [Paenibacillus eucommiae]|uniref:Uncharacterized protein n=1 Tax=Paenibacillus eucommiae TaxID=1355755 RepID=A0ABS4J9P9_9BACL|nr:hypothetical protein [Paenibacillus eucommiae]MBP1995801.1 hypothetical protein [Paenibacillus eucommiae]